MLDFLKHLFGKSNMPKEDMNIGKISFNRDVGIGIHFGPSVSERNGYEVSERMTEIHTQSEFRKAVSGNIAKHDLIIRNGDIESLAPVTQIQGTLGLSDCPIETLSPVKVVKYDIWCSFHYRKPVLKSLGTLQRVEGNASFRYTPLEDLGNLEYVGGNLSLRDTRISNLGKLNHVGGSLYLPKRLKDKLDLSEIFVGGQVRFWNDAKNTDLSTHDKEASSLLHKSDIPVPYWPHTYITPFHDIRQEPKEVQNFYKFFTDCFSQGIVLDTEEYSNYYFMLIFDLQKQYNDPIVLAKKYEILTACYPKLRIYCNDILVDLYKDHQMYEKAWDIVKESSHLTLKTVFYYADIVGDQIFDGSIAAKISGTECLTNFGKSHVQDILPFFRPCLQSLEKEHGCRFFDLFYDRDKGYKSINGKYDPEYYKQFYQLDEASFYVYDKIGKDSYHSKRLDDILVVEHATKEQLSVLFIKAEDAYRESIGLPKIGESWISETVLFNRIKEHYIDYKVIQHGHPKWLGKQHLDIYYSEENIGIEYQGIQHYKPVDYFGGEEGFTSNQERDERKSRLCKENACTLIYVNEGYDFDDVVQSIDKALLKKKRK